MNSLALSPIVIRSLTKEDAPPWVGDEPMPEIDREDPYPHQGRPKNVVDLFDRIGYDLNYNDDFRRLKEDFRWLAAQREEWEKEQKRAEESKPRRFNAFMGLVAAMVGSVLTAVVTWFLSKH